MAEYIKLTGSNKVYKLVTKTALPGHKIQLVVDDNEKQRFVITRQSGCYKHVHESEYEASFEET